MRAYTVFIKTSDGEYGVLSGQFPSDWAAIDMGFALFENAKMVVPRRKEEM